MTEVNISDAADFVLNDESLYEMARIRGVFDSDGNTIPDQMRAFIQNHRDEVVAFILWFFRGAATVTF